MSNLLSNISHLILGKSSGEDHRKRELLALFLFLLTAIVTINTIVEQIISPSEENILVRLAAILSIIPIYVAYFLTRRKYYPKMPLIIISFILLFIYYYLLAAEGVTEFTFLFLAIPMGFSYLFFSIYFATTISLFNIMALIAGKLLYPDTNFDLITFDILIFFFVLTAIFYTLSYFNKLLSDDQIAFIKRSQQQEIESEKLKLIGKFSSQVAHDFNNILTIMQLNVDHLRTIYSDEEMLQDMQHSINRAKIMANKILSIAKQDKEHIQAEIIELNKLIEEFGVMINPIISKDVRLSLETNEEEIFVEVSKTEIYRVLVNLIVNAQEAMPKGGTIKIDVAKCAQSEIKKYRLPISNSVRIRVKDSGSGIDKTIQERMFQPFNSSKPRGSGLGLSICKDIVESYGGAMSYETEPGEGTEFYIFLPQYQSN